MPIAEGALLPIQGDIVQVDPSNTQWAGALIIVTEVRAWGVVGYCPIPGEGLAYIRLKWDGLSMTSGHAVWIEDVE